MSLQASAEYRGGFFDVTLSQYIFKENRWNKGVPKSEPPSHTYYKPRMEILRVRKEVVDATHAFFHGQRPENSKSHNWRLASIADILDFGGLIEEDLVFSRLLWDRMKQFLVDRLGRPNGFEHTPKQRELDEKNYQEFQKALSYRVQQPFIPSPARLAGMIDGSTGGITITSGLTRRDDIEHSLSLRITCDHPGFIEGMIQKYGGGISKTKSEESDEGGPGWEGFEGTAGRALQDAFPDLVLRKAQAGLGLDYLAITKLFDRRTKLPFERTLPHTQQDTVTIFLDGFIYNMQRLNEAARNPK